MSDNGPNSNGFWRRNEIAGRLLMSSTYPPLDPEQMASDAHNRHRLAELQARERQVQERFQRMKVRAHSAKPL